MTEKNRIIRKQFSYTGLFVYKEFFRRLDLWLRDKFYDKKEKGSTEYRHPGAKQISIMLEPWKKVTDYYKITLRVEVTVRDMKTVEVDIDGKKQRLNHGTIECQISSYLSGDYDGRMDEPDKPFIQFLRHMFESYVYKPITKKYQEMAVDDCNDLLLTLQSYLNIFKNKQEESFESGREHTRYS